MMGDITLLAATRNALLSVQDVGRKRDATLRVLVSGKAVDDPIADAVKYYKSKGLSDRAQNYTDIKSDMGQALSSIKVTVGGLSSIRSIYSQMKGLLQAAKVADQSGKDIICKQWDELFKQSEYVANDATYQGKGLLLPADPSIRGDSGSIDVQVSPNAESPKVGILPALLPPATDFD